MTADMIRQGDVLLRPVFQAFGHATAASVAAEGDRFVLAHGEATGHHHSVALSNRVAMFRDDGSGSGGSGGVADGAAGRLFLEVSGKAPVSLEHQEHTALPVMPGVHEVVRQRVYTAGMAARVAD